MRYEVTSESTTRAMAWPSSDSAAAAAAAASVDLEATTGRSPALAPGFDSTTSLLRSTPLLAVCSALCEAASSPTVKPLLFSIAKPRGLDQPLEGAGV